MEAASRPPPSSHRRRDPSRGEAPRTFVVDDHAVYRTGLIELLTTNAALSICGHADNYRRALRGIEETAPDLLVLDLTIPGGTGLDLIRVAHRARPALPIFVLSMHSNPAHAIRALSAGALGYAIKSDPSSEIISGIHRVLGGHLHVSSGFRGNLIFEALRADRAGTLSPVSRLSGRERDVLEALGRTPSIRETAARLSISPKTVETLCARIRHKLDLPDGKHLARFATDWTTLNEPA